MHCPLHYVTRNGEHAHGLIREGSANSHGKGSGLCRGCQNVKMLLLYRLNDELEIIMQNMNIPRPAPSRVAQSIARLTEEPGAPSSIPGLATYFRGN